MSEGKQVKAYKAETEAGINDLGGKVAVACLLRNAEPFPVAHASLSHPRPEGANPGQPDLHYLVSVLATAGWEKDSRGLPAGLNGNYDFFDPEECWAARRSPEDKPVNLEHDGNDIIGHITANLACTAAGPIPDDTPVDSLPPSFDLVTQSVLYLSWWTDKAKAERAQRMVAEIANGEWKVSMECLFRGFDYAVETASGFQCVPRRKDTAFLTKRLRAYGGDGLYRGNRVGRVFRSITFSGKGLVREPANPSSLILPPLPSPVAPAIATAVPVDATPVLADVLPSATPKTASAPLASPPGDLVYAPETKNTVEGAVEIKEQLEAAKAEAVGLKKKADEAEALLATAKAEAAVKLAEAQNAARAELETAKAAAKKAETDKAGVEASLVASQSELAAMKAKEKEAARAAKAKDKLKLDDEKAGAFASTLSLLPDEAFDAQLEAVAKLSVQPAPVPAVKATAAQTLDSAVPVPAPALSTTPDAAAEEVRKSIASWLGRAEPVAK